MTLLLYLVTFLFLSVNAFDLITSLRVRRINTTVKSMRLIETQIQKFDIGSRIISVTSFALSIVLLIVTEVSSNQLHVEILFALFSLWICFYLSYRLQPKWYPGMFVLVIATVGILSNPLVVALSSALRTTPSTTTTVASPPVAPSPSATATATPTPKATATSNAMTNTLQVGTTDSNVKTLQEALSTLGFFHYKEFTNYYGNVTKQAVVAYQQSKGENPTGVVTPTLFAEIEQETGK